MFFKNKITFVCLLLFLLFLGRDIYASNKLFLKNTESVNDINLDLNEEDLKVFNQILQLINKKKWLEAYKLQKKIKDIEYSVTIDNYISWKYYENLELQNSRDFLGLINFSIKNSYLEDTKKFNRVIEEYFIKNDDVKFEDILEYNKYFKFKDIKAIVKILKMEEEIINKLEDEQEKINKKKYFKTKIKNIFLNQKLTFLSSLKSLLAEFGKEYIDESIKIEKIRTLLLYNHKTSADFLMDRLESVDYKLLFNSILQIERRPAYISHILRNIPKEMRDDESLSYSKMKYYYNTGNKKEALNILHTQGNNLEHGDRWFIFRNLFVRELIQERDFKKAYRIISRHKVKNRLEYSLAEWLSGWIALEFLDKPEVAKVHFNNMLGVVKNPTSVSKATYWLARTYEALKDQKVALYWYNLSSNYSLDFYGQLSYYAKYNLLNKNNRTPPEHKFPDIPKVKKIDEDNIRKNQELRTAILFYKYSDNKDEGIKIFRKLVFKLKTKGQIAVFIKFLEGLGDERILVPVAKSATYRNVFFVDHLYPMLRMVNRKHPNMALVHALIKQESGFIVYAKSSAGATGFMQIMPATGKEICKDLGITYSYYKLKNDGQYNIKLGTYYINKLLKQYNGFPILAIAAYNGGPNSVARWIKNNGDPRKFNDIRDVVNWIELITYAETRNYVQKVLENLVAYEQMLLRN